MRTRHFAIIFLHRQINIRGVMICVHIHAKDKIFIHRDPNACVSKYVSWLCAECFVFRSEVDISQSCLIVDNRKVANTEVK